MLEAVVLGRYILRAVLPVVFATSSVLSAALTVQDDRGQAVVLDAPPKRVVSLLPSLTESVCALGACDRLVGVDRYSNWPASVQQLPKLGGGLDPNIEAVVAARPDVVLMATSTPGGDRLRALGVKVLALEPKTHADMRRTLETLSRVLGLPEGRAEQVWAQIDRMLVEVASGIPLKQRGLRVYIEVSTVPHAASASSFMGETLQRLGQRNIVGPENGPFPQVNPEWVVRQQPEVIIAADSHLPSMLARPGWSSLQAVQSKRVCAHTPQESDVLVRPGPRLAEAARLMARCFQERP
jgi:iron complex transport system substrate-binding protein